MAFESLSAKLQATIKRLKGQTRVTEKDVKEFMREIRMALLEADVNYKVVKDFIARVSEKAVGQEVLESLSPGQQIVKIVDDELTGLLGADDYKLDLSKTPPNVILLVGLQGTGKTTACAKLAAHLRKQGRKPLMAACDIYRPAAVQQLQVLGRQIDIPVYTEEPGAKAADIARNAVKSALRSRILRKVSSAFSRRISGSSRMESRNSRKEQVTTNAISAKKIRNFVAENRYRGNRPAPEKRSRFISAPPYSPARAR